MAVGKHDEQVENDAFVRLVGGVAKADRMQQLWKLSSPQGAEYDKLKGKRARSQIADYGKAMVSGRKEEDFRRRAVAEGFTGEQVNRFLDLP